MTGPTAARLGAAHLHRLDGMHDREAPKAARRAVRDNGWRNDAKGGLEHAGAAPELTGAWLVI